MVGFIYPFEKNQICHISTITKKGPTWQTRRAQTSTESFHRIKQVIPDESLYAIKPSLQLIKKQRLESFLNDK